jgi:UDP-3-O-[3-hydroxymyristoyl] N-acetylglucosamine deacetylase
MADPSVDTIWSEQSAGGGTQGGEAQTTLAGAVERQGVGLHSGATTRVKLCPAEPDQGRFFVRVDLPGRPDIPATVSAVDQTLLSTELRRGEATVRTVEHLLAALAGLGLDNVRIEVDGPELPLLDGSAREWATAIESAGRVAQAATRPPMRLPEPVFVQREDAFITAFPAATCRLTYGIDFDVAAIGNQWFSWTPTVDPSAPGGFIEALAPARTFGLAHQIEYLRKQGLIKGGSLDNALVCSHEGWLNPPLRFDNEPVRHKLLDLLGDLSLLGYLPPAHIVAYKASHGLHAEFAKTLQTTLEVHSGAL